MTGTVARAFSPASGRAGPRALSFRPGAETTEACAHIQGEFAGRPLADVAARRPDDVRRLLSLDLLDDTRTPVTAVVGRAESQ